MNQPQAQPPPHGPVPPAPAYQTGAPPKPNRRPLVIGLVAAAVVAVLCLGVGCVGAVVFYLRDGRLDAGGGGTDTPDGPGTTSAQCAGTVTQPHAQTKPVGLPDFDGAPAAGTATMRMSTNLGQIEISMDRSRTPCTVASFQHLADRKFFDGSSCHRLVTEGIFVLQCGDPSSTGLGGPDYRFTDENLGGAQYGRGVVAMANTGEPGSNGSQFFIIFRDSSSGLQPLYTPFGTVTTGLDVVDRVAAGGHDNSISAGGGKPNQEITIQTLSVG
ncbi:peptidylprolyl isomerase [Plantactinospora sp. WMMB782]|uniref:peptidylprolyl isomerase n=1 Tax=Plantactinospora sp. WMMB782 TaxID=3404121 RepID=UPI003B935733